MQWLPPKGLDTLKTIACNRGLWEDLGNGYITKKGTPYTGAISIGDGDVLIRAFAEFVKVTSLAVTI